MKSGFLVMSLSTALLVAAMSENAAAGLSGANSADPESAMNQAWMPQGPTETGMVPEAPGGASEAGRIDPGGTDITLVEAGGMRYRIGIDTGP